jgi:hypothetical protein
VGGSLWLLKGYGSLTTRTDFLGVRVKLTRYRYEIPKASTCTSLVAVAIDMNGTRMHC